MKPVEAAQAQAGPPPSLSQPVDWHLSVVVVNWNRKDLLRECLTSLTLQRERRFELILVDNGSTDGSAEMVEAEFLNPGRLRGRILRNERNEGFCRANNQGITASRSRFVALINNDAVADAGWLEQLLAAFDDDTVGMAASKILVYEDPRRIDKVGHLIYWDGQNRGRGSGELDHGQYDQVEEVAWPDGCAAMYRREMLDRVGGFDEDFFAYADDADLGLRGRIAGFRCLYMPRAVVFHRRGATLGTGSRRRLELIERNRVLLAAKLLPWRILWLNPVFYALRLIAGVIAAFRGRGEMSRYPGWRGKAVMALALLRGDWQALWLLPRMLAKRKEIHRFRKLTSAEVLGLLRRYQIPLRTLTEQAI